MFNFTLQDADDFVSVDVSLHTRAFVTCSSKGIVASRDLISQKHLASRSLVPEPSLVSASDSKELVAIVVGDVLRVAGLDSLSDVGLWQLPSPGVCATFHDLTPIVACEDGTIVVSGVTPTAKLITIGKLDELPLTIGVHTASNRVLCAGARSVVSLPFCTAHDTPAAAESHCVPLQDCDTGSTVTLRTASVDSEAGIVVGLSTDGLLCQYDAQGALVSSVQLSENVAVAVSSIGCRERHIAVTIINGDVQVYRPSTVVPQDLDLACTHPMGMCTAVFVYPSILGCIVGCVGGDALLVQAHEISPTQQPVQRVAGPEPPKEPSPCLAMLATLLREGDNIISVTVDVGCVHQHAHQTRGILRPSSTRDGSRPGTQQRSRGFIGAVEDHINIQRGLAAGGEVPLGDSAPAMLVAMDCVTSTEDLEEMRERMLVFTACRLVGDMNDRVQYVALPPNPKSAKELRETLEEAFDRRLTVAFESNSGKLLELRPQTLRQLMDQDSEDRKLVCRPLYPTLPKSRCAATPSPSPMVRSGSVMSSGSRRSIVDPNLVKQERKTITPDIERSMVARLVTDAQVNRTKELARLEDKFAPVAEPHKIAPSRYNELLHRLTHDRRKQEAALRARKKLEAEGYFPKPKPKVDDDEVNRTVHRLFSEGVEEKEQLHKKLEKRLFQRREYKKMATQEEKKAWQESMARPIGKKFREKGPHMALLDEE